MVRYPRACAISKLQRRTFRRFRLLLLCPFVVIQLYELDRPTPKGAYEAYLPAMYNNGS